MCKQPGWKSPPSFSDPGSVVYRRGNTVVKCTAYNTHFISWLQLIYEGRIAAIAGSDWRSVFETLRIRYQQLEKQNGKKINEPAEVIKYLKFLHTRTLSRTGV